MANETVESGLLVLATTIMGGINWWNRGCTVYEHGNRTKNRRTSGKCIKKS